MTSDTFWRTITNILTLSSDTSAQYSALFQSFFAFTLFCDLSRKCVVPCDPAAFLSRPQTRAASSLSLAFCTIINFQSDVFTLQNCLSTALYQLQYRIISLSSLVVKSTVIRRACMKNVKRVNEAGGMSGSQVEVRGTPPGNRRDFYVCIYDIHIYFIIITKTKPKWSKLYFDYPLLRELSLSTHALNYMLYQAWRVPNE